MTTVQQMYVAVVPPANVVQTIDRLPTRAQRGIRYTKRDRWHITVKFLGDVNPNQAVAALAHLDAPATAVTLGPAVALLGNRVVMIPAAGLDELAVTVGAAFEAVGEPQPDREFTAHLTLARLRGAPLRDPSTISVLGAAISETFQAAGLALFGTELTPDGSVRTLIAERALTA